MSRGRLLGAGCVAAAAIILIAAGAFKTTSGGGRSAPALPSEVLRGHPVTLSSLHGSPAVVNFWASWCTPCRQEAPELERFARSNPGVAVVGVDWNDAAGSARAFIRHYGLTYRVLRDGSGSVGTSYGLSGLPTTFVLDSHGRIAATLRGPQTAADLRHATASLG
jgi:cytochrome c biogenesis protein CcmG, thiol:disulfide interchange protein DsbE